MHAHGFGIHGEFELADPIPDLTRASFLAGEKGKKTSPFCRFSIVPGRPGSPDLARDVRGFAVKFDTDKDNSDLVGNNIPVFFIQDAIKFPDLIHSVKPAPDRGFLQAQSAHDNFWDFVSLTPEFMRMVMWQMSDRTIPRACPMNGFASYEALVDAPKVRHRSETFADHYSQARQFSVSQEPIEQSHLGDALTFGPSKVGRMDIRKRIIGHLRHIDAALAKTVCDGIGLDTLPEKVPLAREPITELPASDALSILKNGPNSLKGRKLGIYIAAGADAKIVNGLKKAAEDAGSIVGVCRASCGRSKIVGWETHASQ